MGQHRLVPTYQRMSRAIRAPRLRMARLDRTYGLVGYLPAVYDREPRVLGAVAWALGPEADCVCLIDPLNHEHGGQVVIKFSVRVRCVYLWIMELYFV